MPCKRSILTKECEKTRCLDLFKVLKTSQFLHRKPAMTVKFSEDLVPLTDLKVNPGRVVKHTTEVHRPVLLTSRGRGVAVVQSLVDYEKAEEEREFMRAVVAGLADLEAGPESGREWCLEDVRSRLGLD